MIRLASQVIGLCLLASVFSAPSAVAHPQPAKTLPPKPEPDVEEVRMWLTWIEFEEFQLKWFLDRGEAVFPAFEKILADPKSKSMHVLHALNILSNMKYERKRFLEIAVGLLAHMNGNVRSESLQLLEQIGSERDTAPVAVLLSDDDASVRYCAAKTLAAIGGKRDLVAMDAWLKSGRGDYRDAGSLGHVKKCRDALERRLKDISKDMNKYDPIPPPRAVKP